MPTQDQIEDDVFNMNHGLGDIGAPHQHTNYNKGVTAAAAAAAAVTSPHSQLSAGSLLGSSLPTIFTSNRIPVHPATNPLVGYWSNAFKTLILKFNQYISLSNSGRTFISSCFSHNKNFNKTLLVGGCGNGDGSLRTTLNVPSTPGHRPTDCTGHTMSYTFILHG